MNRNEARYVRDLCEAVRASDAGDDPEKARLDVEELAGVAIHATDQASHRRAIAELQRIAVEGKYKGARAAAAQALATAEPFSLKGT